MPCSDILINNAHMSLYHVLINNFPLNVTIRFLVYRRKIKLKKINSNHHQVHAMAQYIST